MRGFVCQAQRPAAQVILKPATAKVSPRPRRAAMQLCRARSQAYIYHAAQQKKTGRGNSFKTARAKASSDSRHSTKQRERSRIQIVGPGKGRSCAGDPPGAASGGVAALSWNEARRRRCPSICGRPEHARGARNRTLVWADFRCDDVPVNVCQLVPGQEAKHGSMDSASAVKPSTTTKNETQLAYIDMQRGAFVPKRCL